MSRQRVAFVLALFLLAIPAFGIGPGLDHGGRPEAQLGVPAVVMMGEVPLLIPQALVHMASWLHATTTDAV